METPDELHARSRPRWFWIVILLVTLAGMGAATFVLLRVQERMQSKKKGFVTMSMPGTRIQVPRWRISVDERRTVPGQVVFRSPDGSGHLRIRWVPGFSDSLETLARLDRIKGHVGRKLRWVSTHRGALPLWPSVHKSSGRSVVQSTWLCTRPFVRYFLYARMGTDQKALWKWVRRILSSVRCDIATLENVRIRRLPHLECEECSFSRAPDGRLDALGRGRDLYRLHFGRWGRRSPAQMTKDVMQALRIDLAVPDQERREKQVIQALASETAGQRTVHTFEGVDRQNKKRRLQWTVFFCPAVKQTFVATVTSDSDDPLAPSLERRRLRQLRCPARKTITEVLTDQGSEP